MKRICSSWYRPYLIYPFMISTISCDGTKPCPIRRCTTLDFQLQTSTHAEKGRRMTMEDASFVSPNGRFSAIFDGHGGSDVSTYLSKHIYSEFQHMLSNQGNILGLIGSEGKDIARALRKALLRMDLNVQKQLTWDHQGSTATVVFLDSHNIWVAHTGDSRAVLSRRGVSISLTQDHRPENMIEKRRILSLGGDIDWFGRRDHEGFPIPGTGVYRVNGNLAMTRAIGDKSEKPYITAEPDVNSVPRDITGDQFVVVATDGLWDVLNNQEVVDFVHETLKSAIDSDVSITTLRNDMAKHIVQKAWQMGSSDNIAVVVIWLQ